VKKIWFVVQAEEHETRGRSRQMRGSHSQGMGQSRIEEDLLHIRAVLSRIRKGAYSWMERLFFRAGLRPSEKDLSDHWSLRSLCKL
jgi:hypothetical protein